MVYVKTLSSSAKQPRCSCTTAVLCQLFSAVGHVPLAARGAKGWTGYGPRSGVATVATSLVESVFNTGRGVRAMSYPVMRVAQLNIMN